jgi:hypothetical protein
MQDLRTAFVRPNVYTDTDIDRFLDRVRAYLPRNYGASIAPAGTVADVEGILVYGRDSAGWTLDGYVIPRLASGSMFAEEVAV